MENQLKQLLTDDDRDKLKALLLSLKNKENNIVLYKDTLANVLRRTYELTSILQKVHRRTEQEVKDCEALVIEIKGFLSSNLPC